MIGNVIGISFGRRRGRSWGYTDAQTQTLIDAGYIPVGTHQDLDAVRADQVDRTWAAGTKWEKVASSTGLAGSYIQVADIDLYDECRTGGAYDNAGAGWSPINTFSGIYNGAGYIINGLYINRGDESYVSLFRVLSGRLKNIAVIDAEMADSVYYSGVLIGRIDDEGIVENCITSGILKTNNHHAGGIAGSTNASVDITGGIINCYCAVDIISTSGIRNGGLIGLNRGIVKNSFSLGSVNTQGDSVGGLIGQNTNSVLSSFYNTETSGQSDTGRGTPKTTTQMLSGIPSAEIFTDWDNEIDAVTGKPVWEFKVGRYPILSIFGELAANIPAPVNLQVDIVEGSVQLDWQDHANASAPKGYDVYQSIDGGAWTKVNTNLITTKSFLYEPTIIGEYNYFVKAVYSIRNF